MITGERLKRFMCEGRGCMHKVVIFKEGGKYRVEPGRLVVHPGAKVAFVSLLGQAAVHAWFPPGLVKDPHDRIKIGRTPVPIEIGGNTGVFPYEVQVHGLDGVDYAEGGSAARMIVADP